MTRDEFQTFSRQIRPVLLSQASKMLGDSMAAEDVAQDTLLKMWNMRDRLDAYKSSSALAVVIARNLCLDLLKRPASRKASLDEIAEPSAGVITPFQQLSAREDVDNVMRLMETLPAGVQAIMRMRHVEGMETQEIADLIGATVESVRVSLSRGRKRMKELFSKQYR